MNNNMWTVDIIRTPNEFARGGGMTCYTEPALYTNPADQHNREQRTELQTTPVRKLLKNCQM